MATKAKGKRVTIEIRWQKAHSRWAAFKGDQVFMAKTTKVPLVKDVAKTLRRSYSAFGYPTELVIKGKDGRIQDKRTYGADPRNVKG